VIWPTPQFTALPELEFAMSSAHAKTIHYGIRILPLAGFLLLAGCGQMGPQSYPPQPTVAYNPPSPTLTNLPASEVNRYHVNFASGSDQIGASGMSAIKGAAAVMQANPMLKATVIGSSDSVGDDATNMRLSRQRALAVHHALLQTGLVTESRIETRWTGQRLANGAPNTAVAGVTDRSVEIALH